MLLTSNMLRASWSSEVHASHVFRPRASPLVALPSLRLGPIGVSPPVVRSRHHISRRLSGFVGRVRLQHAVRTRLPVRGQHPRDRLLVLGLERQRTSGARRLDALGLLLFDLFTLSGAPSCASILLGHATQRRVDVHASSRPRRLAAALAIALPAHGACRNELIANGVA